MASAEAQERLRQGFPTSLFRLGSADAINAKLSFPASGHHRPPPGAHRDANRRHEGTDADLVVKTATLDSAAGGAIALGLSDPGGQARAGSSAGAPARRSWRRAGR